MANLMDAPDVLKKIAAYKADEVETLRNEISPEELRIKARNQAPTRGFARAIKSANKAALICEIKKASPSKGIIRTDFDPIEISQAYESGGATCLSILTDGPGFGGSNAIFKAVRTVTNLPLLRKDFMLDPIQITESRAMGADCVLVILAMIDDDSAKALMDEATALDMDVLVETHNEAEIMRALNLGATFIGINNRDLRTFETSLDNFARLAPNIPDSVTLIAESGIFTRAHVKTLTAQGAQGFLIGESLMRQDDVAVATQALL